MSYLITVKPNPVHSFVDDRTIHAAYIVNNPEVHTKHMICVLMCLLLILTLTCLTI